ncbi:Uncharacterized protein PRO82_001409 [Candidatus Protochlamydia amoebophila]|uniref:hypothetical protein n=1 Tax=Candidatus Protochlamydia amoebophila TaxID=362787 RepID=UPI001BC8EB74|nr:hypothetical protein [Candidatus Protochlamydia amoebophila]MBS4164093.1 Uncharacterized protein [Candidatus Protochlamydia amoebophila]
MAQMDANQYKEILKRLGKQLSLNEKILADHPSAGSRLIILQTFLHHLERQTDWSREGPLSRFRQTFELALIGDKTGNSQAGFIGPALEKLEYGIEILIEKILKPTDKNLCPLLLHFSQVMTWAMIFVSSQTLGNWKKLFPLNDFGVAKEGSELLRELGITFILGSKAIPSFYAELGNHLNLDDQAQRHLSDIGLCHFLILLVIVKDVLELHDDFLFIIQRFMKPSLKNMETLINQNPHPTPEEQKILVALNFLINSIDLQDIESFKQALKTSFEGFEISHEQLKTDMQVLITVCKQLNESLKNIFYQSDLTMTSMTQSA